jgi:hypothetical protein
MLNNTINKIPATPTRLPAEDYEYLRSTSLEYLQKIAGKLWTDYNIHDPGVTILELLCYALTDLAYRTSFDVPDILTGAEGKSLKQSEAFYSAKQILTTHPVSIADYRKMLIDEVPGLRNVWLIANDNEVYNPKIHFNNKLQTLSMTAPAGPHETLKLKGLYTIKIEMEEWDIVDSFHHNFFLTLEKYQANGSKKLTTQITEIKKEKNKVTKATKEKAFVAEYEMCCLQHICKLMSDRRNLCEDVEKIASINEERVGICMDVELEPDADTKAIWFGIYNDIYNYITPGINLYSFQQLLDKGKRIEDIFQGSISQRGFIDYDELEKFDHREVIYTSDLVNIIMDIKGVRAVKDIHLSSYIKNGAGDFVIKQNAKKHCLHITDKYDYTFRLALDFDETDAKKRFNKINFSKGLIYFDPPYDESITIRQVIQHRHFPDKFISDLPWPEGSDRETGNYYSIQNDFPKNYMLGQDGIPSTVSTLRKAQRLQLKGFLVFFEQLLADYLAQLNNVRYNLSWNSDGNAKTYYYQQLTEIKNELGFDEISDISQLMQEYDSGGYDYQKLLETTSEKTERRNRFLNHMLARFNENFVDYSLFKFSHENENYYSNYSGAQLVEKKINFLNQYPKISSGRSHAINYRQSPTLTGNISGLEYRIGKMLGVTGTAFKKLVTIKKENGTNNEIWADGKYRICDNRNSTFESTFGLHLIEHILLRPLHTPKNTDPFYEPLKLSISNNGKTETLQDPYSMKISVVLPGWLSISEDTHFRAFVEQNIRLEAPAHIAMKICWLNPVQMYQYEKAYLLFIEALGIYRNCNRLAGKQPMATERSNYITALQALQNVIISLKNHYPASVLKSCEDGDEIMEENSIKQPVILNHSALAGATGTGYEFVNCTQ